MFYCKNLSSIKIPRYGPSNVRQPGLSRQVAYSSHRQPVRILSHDERRSVNQNGAQLSGPNDSRTLEKAARRQGIYWMLTIPHYGFTPFLPPIVAYIKGQLESGHESGYLHWQLMLVFKRKKSLHAIKGYFGDYHAELTRSDAASEYVWKEDTRVCGTQFELGAQPFQRNDSTHWDRIRKQAEQGNFEEMPSQIYICHYRNLRQIAMDNIQPIQLFRRVRVYCGTTGTGKSYRAWSEATLNAYPKDPGTKFWYGYNRQENVVIDEFRGEITIANLLRWVDDYPCIVETKGSGCALVCRNIWITSNLHPRNWYPSLDPSTMDALLRRLEIVEMNTPFNAPPRILE